MGAADVKEVMNAQPIFRVDDIFGRRRPRKERFC